MFSGSQRKTDPSRLDDHASAKNSTIWAYTEGKGMCACIWNGSAICLTFLCAIPLLLPKVFDWFLTTFWLISFWQLSDVFYCIWPIRMWELWEVELSLVGKPTFHLATPPPTVLPFWLTSLNRSQQTVTMLSQTNQKLCQGDNGMMHSTVI